jgi:hypothetical protein
MHPFDFIIVFLSFIYALALTHLLFAATRMIRHRRELIFSWPHALWMLAIALTLGANWLSLWDFHTLQDVGLATIVAGLVFSTVQYFVCALVSPDFEVGETYDMRMFHEREYRSYIGAYLVLFAISIVLNYAAGAGLAIQNWAAQNAIVIVMGLLVIPPFFTARNWVHVLCAAAMIATSIAFTILYYPVLKVA